ncbi:MAG: 50S ribosomal protein L25/general stress protein Ctc [Pseudomonadota bacterium]
MKETFEINAEARSDTGKGASRRLRRAGMVPGIIYGTGKDPEMISVDHNELIKHLEHEAFYSHILAVKVDGTPRRVVLKDLQRHPAKPFVMHLDFLRVSESEKIKMHVPLHFLGEESAPGVKAGGTASHHLTDVEVSCLPKDLPEYIELDVSGMDLGDAVHLSELQLPEGVELTALSHGDEHARDMAVISLAMGRGPKAEEEEEEAEAEEPAAEGEQQD